MTTTRETLTTATATVGTKVHKGNGAAVYVITAVQHDAIGTEVRLTREGKNTKGGLWYPVKELQISK